MRRGRRACLAAAAFLLGILCFREAITVHGIVEKSLHWITFGGFSLELGIRVDGLASMIQRAVKLRDADARGGLI